MTVRKNQTIVFILVVFLLLFLLTVIPSTAAGLETLITTGTPVSNQENPSISGNIIAWEDHRSGGSEIYLYDLSSGVEQRISNPAADAHTPMVSGNSVVWLESNANGGDIYYYSILSHSITRITDYPATKIRPRISGTRIVWQEEIYPDDGSGIVWYDVQLHDMNTGLTHNLTQAAVDPGPPTHSHETPSIDGNLVVWVDWDDARGSYAIVSMDTASANPADWPLTETVVSDPAAAVDPLVSFPVISGQYIVWADMRDGDFGNIYLYDSLNPPEQDILNPHNINTQRFPAMSGSRITYQDNDNIGSYQLAVYDVGSGSVTDYPLTEAQRVYGSSFPVIDGDRIVWADNRHPGGQTDIYMFTIGAGGTCPVANFTPLSASGPPPLTVTFRDISDPAPTFWHWDFGNGASATTRTATHTYASPGTFRVNLTVGNANCRNMSQDHIIAGGPPTVRFTASPTEGIVPLTVAFNSGGTIGTVNTWAWDFGDGHSSALQNPTHSYDTAGTFSVTLDATNADGTGSLTRTNYIIVKPGIQETALTSISGFTIIPAGSVEQLTLDKGLFGAANHTIPISTMLVTKPAPSFGWQNITFLSDQGAGFVETLPDISGTFYRVFLQSNDLNPPGFNDASVGSAVTVSQTMDWFAYPAGGTLTTGIWEGVLTSDTTNFYNVISNANFANMNIAYTITTARSGMSAPSNSSFNMSVRSSWVASAGDIVEGRRNTYLIGTGYDGGGNHIGIIIPARYLFNNSGYEYFRADIPSNMGYLSKFALAKLSGSGNVFQMVYLGVEEHFGGNQPSDSDSGTGPGTGTGTGQAPISLQNQPPLNQPLANPPVPTTKSVDLYINDQGVVTQTTVLGSADNLAAIAIGQGVTALDARGNPLSSVSIDTLTADQIAGMPSPGTLSFAGLAYNFQPDGATFAPAVTITFTVPNAQWSQQYRVREFDAKTGSWVDLPTTYNPESGTISASVSQFCCIALFSSAVPVKVPAPGSKTTPALPEAIPTPAASSQIGIMYNMIAFITGLVVKNLYLVLIIVAIIAALYLRGRRGRLDRIRYNL